MMYLQKILEVKKEKKLFRELGFDNVKGQKYAATKELLKDYKSLIPDAKTGVSRMRSVMC